VKVTVDAYDGTLKFYVVDPEDPIVQVWQRAFPELFSPNEDVSDDLRAHFRYPEDLFKVQATQFAQYHVEDAGQYFSGEDFWGLPKDPDSDERTLTPYYVLMRLPGEEREEFVLFVPFTPNNRPNMIAWFAAKSDPESYGELTAFEFQSGQSIDGPVQISRRINQDTDVSQQRTLLGQAGSNVVFGNLLAIPVENSFLYVQPMYLEATGSAGGIPELKRVILVHGQTVTIADTLQEALDESFGTGGGDEEPPPPPDDTERTIEELLAEALRHFNLAETALRNSDLATYQREIALAREAVLRAQELLAEGSGTPDPTPTASPTA
jgi:hypothetical protein